MSDTVLGWLFGGWSFKDSQRSEGNAERLGRRNRVATASTTVEPVTTADDAPLVAAVTRGDSQAFAQLFHRYYPDLVTFASKLLESPDRAEDVVQLVMWRLWERRAALDPTRSVRSFLLVAVRNRIYNANREDRRDSRRRIQAMEDPLVAKHADADDLVNDPLDRARAAITTLALPDQEILRLRLQGLSLAEIGHLLGIRPQAAAVRMTRAMARLRKAAFQESSPNL